MREKRPVNKQPSTNQILEGNRSPETTVGAVITVVTQGEVTIARHRVYLIRFRQIFGAEGITLIRGSRRHHTFKAVALRSFAIDVKRWRIDAQLVSRQTGQSLDIKRRSGNRIRRDRRNIICSEDENVPVPRFNKVVAALIDKDLVARVDRAPGDNLAAMNKPTGKDVKVLAKRVGRGVYEETLPLAHQSRKGKEEGYFLWHDLKNLVVLARNHVDVIPTQKNEFDRLSQNIWRGLAARMTDNSV